MRSVDRRGWPTTRFSPSEVLLLRAAGSLVQGDALESWRAFREQIPSGSEGVGDRRLFPMVCRNLTRAGETVPEELRRAYAECVGANARLLDEAARGLDALARAGIPVLVLKGTALLVAHYRDTGARPMSDVDLLVPKARIEEALRVLSAVGWKGHTAQDWRRPGLHAATLSGPGGLSADVHVHATYEATYAAADAAFFADAVPVMVAGAPALAMSAEDQLLHSVVHGLRWSIARSPVWVLDALTLMRAAPLDLERIAARARDLRLRVALADGLDVIGQVVDPGPQAGALIRLLRRNPIPFSERIEQRFRVREPAGWLGALPNLWFAYLRCAPQGEAPSMDFGVFLRATWDVGDRSLSSIVARKVRRRLFPSSSRP